MLSTRSRFRVLSEIAEEEDAKIKDTIPTENEITQIENKRERRRKKIIRELFETEKTYISHLELVNKHFDFPLKFNCIIPRNIHLKLFSNIEQILEVNKKLLDYMEQTSIGQAFRFLGPFLKLYSTYANNHDQALTTLQDWLHKSASFSAFVHDQEDVEDLNGLKLNALLITPIQRIPRYKMLLEDLLNNTPLHHHDYEQLKEAAQQVGEIASHINEHIRQHENFQKMLSIQNSFDSSAPNILAPGRQFIKEGPLRKVSRKGGKSHERMFFLFSDMLLYGKPKFLEGSKSYSCCCILPLKHCQAEALFGNLKNHDGGGMFRVSCKDENLVLYSSDQEEVQSWIETLQAAINTLCCNRQTLKKPSSKNMPLRGRTMLRNKLQQRKDKLKRKALHSVEEESTPECRSPCSSVNFPAVMSPLQCLTPPKRTKSDKENEREEDNLEHFNFNIEANQSLDEEVHLDSLDQSDNTFMQMTVDEFGSTDLTLNSFEPSGTGGNIDPPVREATEIYYVGKNSSNTNNTSCAQRPLQGLLEQGRKVSRLVHNAHVRLRHSTHSSCSLQ